MESRALPLVAWCALALCACVYDFDGFEVDDGLGAGAAGSGSSSSSGGASTSGSGPSGTSGGGEGGGGCSNPVGVCEPWWDSAWSGRHLVTIDNAGLDETLEHFPWPLRFDASQFGYASAKGDGSDLRFVAFDESEVYPHDVEQWNVSGRSVVWVRLTKLPPASAGKLRLWMYHGNSAAELTPSAKAWNDDFVSVHHLSSDLRDATVGAHHGTSPTATSTPSPSAAGVVGACYAFDGDDHVRLPTEQDFDFTTTLSVSLWVDPAAWSKNRQVLVGKGGNAWNLVRRDQTPELAFQTTHGANVDQFLAGTSDVSDGGWHHVAVRYDGAQKQLYVDGALESAVDFTQTLNNSATQVAFGENLDNTGRQFEGLMDEVRISRAPRSAAWFRFEHLSVGAPARTELGPAQPRP